MYLAFKVEGEITAFSGLGIGTDLEIEGLNKKLQSMFKYEISREIKCVWGQDSGSNRTGQDGQLGLRDGKAKIVVKRWHNGHP